jgi:hypothetical protein
MGEPRLRQPRTLRENMSCLLKVRCTPTERAQVEARAKAAGLPLSEYVRVSALHATINSRVDYAAVTTLARNAGELNRLGDLLKLWLLERRGDGAPAIAVGGVLSDIKVAVERLTDAVMRI